MKTLCFMFRGDEYRVNEKGYIKANGLTYFSKDWRFIGGSPHHWHQRIVVTVAEAFRDPKRLNGCLGWDVDHGTLRKWGGCYFGKLPRIQQAYVETRK